MERAQVYTLVNNATMEAVGKSVLLNEDLSNVVDVGNEIFNANAVDNYVRSLLNHIGKVVFVNRAYSGSAPSVLMDGWEYGSVLEKIRTELPEATENESWELQAGETYNQDIFYKPTVTAKFFNKRVTFEIPMSFAEKQVKESFSSATQLNSFVSMIYTAIDNSMTVKTDALIMRTITNMISETLYDAYEGSAMTGDGGPRAVNLLYLYNQRFGASLAAAAAITNPDFLKFAAMTMGVYVKRMAKISTIFNIGGTEKFTPADTLHVVMLADFKQAADVYLQSDTFHNEMTRLPGAEEVPYWQGSGTGYAFSDITAIKVKNASGNTVEASGILAVMFDRDALGVSNIDRRVTSHRNNRAEFFTNWYKFDAGYFNDTNENFVVFFVA